MKLIANVRLAVERFDRFTGAFNMTLGRLKEKLNWILESRLFGGLFGLSLFISPIAQLPQLYKAITAPSVVGISVETYIIMLYNFSVIMLYGIKQTDWRIVVALGMGIVEFILIISITMLRGGSLLGWML